MSKNKQISDFMWKEIWPALSNVMDPEEKLKTNREANSTWKSWQKP